MSTHKNKIHDPRKAQGGAVASLVLSFACAAGAGLSAAAQFGSLEGALFGLATFTLMSGVQYLGAWGTNHFTNHTSDFLKGIQKLNSNTLPYLIAATALGTASTLIL